MLGFYWAAMIPPDGAGGERRRVPGPCRLSRGVGVSFRPRPCCPFPTRPRSSTGRTASQYRAGSATSTSRGIRVWTRLATSSSRGTACASAGPRLRRTAVSRSAKPGSALASTSSLRGPSGTRLPRRRRGCATSASNAIPSPRPTSRAHSGCGANSVAIAVSCSRSGARSHPVGTGSCSAAAACCSPCSPATWARFSRGWTGAWTHGSSTGSRRRRTPRCGDRTCSSRSRACRRRARPARPTPLPARSAAGSRPPGSPSRRPQDSGASGKCCAACCGGAPARPGAPPGSLARLRTPRNAKRS